ncbi:sodium proton exchanger, putative [Actinidia rufa]|uniref:Sodium proton exchanger, putative n=1 Tax=Actinidia rufa TaxID=165716 RepID=A0A7J0DMH5_9ERIC|nr:sodium proton exchanger, putative [Actinidia rufa]
MKQQRESMQVACFLFALLSSFDGAHSQILGAMKIPSLSEVFSHLHQAFLPPTALSPAKPSALAPSVGPYRPRGSGFGRGRSRSSRDSSGSGYGQGRGPRRCTHCKQENHLLGFSWSFGCSSAYTSASSDCVATHIPWVIDSRAFNHIICTTLDLQLGKKIGGGSECSGLRYFDTDVSPSVALRSTIDPYQLHCRLGHPSRQILKKLQSSGNSYITSDTGTLFVFFTGGIVFLTLIVNGSTTQFVLRFLNMDKLSPAKRRILDFTKYEMLNKALEAFGDLGDDEELGPVDWPTVKRYISSLNHVEGERVHPHSVSGNDNNLDCMNLKDIRIRLLNGVQSAYWGMLDEGRIMQSTANLLMQSVDEAIDLVVSHEPLCDWKGLKAYVHFPNHYKFLQTSLLPQKLVTHFTVERLESACYICAAFLRAHRIARRQLHDFIGKNFP